MTIAEQTPDAQDGDVWILDIFPSFLGGSGDVSSIFIYSLHIVLIQM